MRILIARQSAREARPLGADARFAANDESMSLDEIIERRERFREESGTGLDKCGPEWDWMEDEQEDGNG